MLQVLDTMSTLCGKVNNSNKVKLTLQEYRKQVGLKVINQKSNQKLGISAKCESPSDGQKESSVHSFVALCPHCGFSNVSHATKCVRCMRVFEKTKEFPSPELLPESSSLEISQMTKEPCTYGKRRPRIQDCQTSRQLRTKFEEPQCVILSSDEDEEDSLQDSKKLKCDTVPESDKFCSTSPVRDFAQTRKGKEDNTDNEILDSPTTMKEKECSIEFHRWKDGGLVGPFSAVSCRSVRIGSYKFAPSSRVLFSSEGIMLQAPYFDPTAKLSSKQWITVAISTEHLLNVEVHFKRSLPAIFLYVTPGMSRKFSARLGLHKTTYYWDSASPEESQRRLTLLPVSLDDSAKNAIQQAFVPKGLFREISYEHANRLLVQSSPPEVRIAIERLPATTAITAETMTSNILTPVSKGSPIQVEKRVTRGVSAKSTPVIKPLPVIRMFSWSDGPDKFSVTTEDYFCLNQDNLLNDSIIDFYIRYIFSTKLESSFKERCHVFSSFFYQRLTTPPSKTGGRKHPVEDDPSLTLKEKRHSRVQSWTKKVDIFEKDYLVIPINERAHWFLAIICFPGLSGPVDAKTNRPVKLSHNERLPIKNVVRSIKKVSTTSGESFHIGNTTITPIGANSKVSKIPPVILSIDTDKDEADSDEEVLSSGDNYSYGQTSQVTEPIKQPCILFFDSLIGSNHYRVATTLREYLMVEYQKKKQVSLNSSKTQEDNDINRTNSELFSKETMISACLEVPQQNNSYDCGVYVLQYAESFMMNPFKDYNLRKLCLANWFSSEVSESKRKSIQYLLIRLSKEANTLANQVLDLLPKEDVDMALKENRVDLSEEFISTAGNDGTLNS